MLSTRLLCGLVSRASHLDHAKNNHDMTWAARQNSGCQIGMAECVSRISYSIQYDCKSTVWSAARLVSGVQLLYAALILFAEAIHQYPVANCSC